MADGGAVDFLSEQDRACLVQVVRQEAARSEESVVWHGGGAYDVYRQCGVSTR